ncbi:MAG: hypothetical protein NC217_04380 [Muribaculaceae bacterium]|nr:hypothetical protein [Muribaculaceae bacterium]
MKLAGYILAACLTVVMAGCSSHNKAKDINTSTSYVGEDSAAIALCTSLIEITDQGTPFHFEVKPEKAPLNLEVDDSPESWTTPSGEGAREKWVALVRLKVTGDELKGETPKTIADILPTLTAEVTDTAGNVILAPLTLSPTEQNRLYNLLAKGQGAEDDILFTLYTSLPVDDDSRGNTFASSSEILLRPVLRTSHTL